MKSPESAPVKRWKLVKLNVNSNLGEQVDELKSISNISHRYFSSLFAKSLSAIEISVFEGSKTLAIGVQNTYSVNMWEKVGNCGFSG